ncbi:MAG: hypothetical protein WAL98_16825 [Desulfatiglandaceae bacterium]
MKEKAGFVKHVLELMAPLVEDARRAVRRTANRKKPKYYREESSCETMRIHRIRQH